MNIRTVWNAIAGTSGPPAMPAGASSETNFAGLSREPLPRPGPSTAGTPPELRPAARPVRPQSPYENARVAPAGPVTVTKALALVGNPRVVDASEERELIQLQASWDALRQFKLDHTQGQADEDYRAHKRLILQQISEGKLQEAHNADIWNLEDWRHDFDVKREQADRQQRVISEESRPIVEKVVRRLMSALEEAAEKIEAQERGEALSWGVPFSPSLRLVTVGKAPEHISRWLPVSGTNFPPAEILKQIGRLNP